MSTSSGAGNAAYTQQDRMLYLGLLLNIEI